MERKLLKVYKNGNKLWGVRTPCTKCHCTGRVIWSYANGICFDCDGKGWYWTEEREYTPENLARLEAKRALARAKWEEEQAKREAERQKAEEERRRIEEERRKAEEARKAISQYVGNVGDRLTAVVKLEKEFSFEVPSFKGWGTDLKHIYIFVDAQGNKLVWKTTSCLGKWIDDNNYEPVQEGDELSIKATIKDHSDYKGEKQTEIQRVKIA